MHMNYWIQMLQSKVHETATLVTMIVILMIVPYTRNLLVIQLNAIIPIG